VSASAEPPATPTESGAPARTTILGLPLDLVTLPALLREIDGYILRSERRTVGYLNMHVLDQAGRDATLVRFLESLDLCYCDGNGVRVAAAIQGVHVPAGLRFTGADWIWDFAAWAEGRHPFFWLGGRPGVAMRAAQKLMERHPGLEINADHGFYAKTGPENDTLLARVNGSGAHVLLVGMGTPIQERWVLENRQRITIPVVWCLGATADFVSGEVWRGPSFLLGQEWLARLVVDPGRLWRRYLLGSWRVVLRAAAGRARGRRQGR
jgi:N-acetylglucosaminyldiphosphoundecaprenol N-acetyl-beta-D-mannosaminyltransferase